MPRKLKEGDLVWAKMKGFPPWPAEVIPPDPEVKQPKKSKESLYVFFFGTEDHAWIETVSLFPYDQHKDRFNKNKTHAFKEAVEKIEKYRETMPPRDVDDVNDGDDDDEEVDASILFGRDDKGNIFANSSSDAYDFIDNEGETPLGLLPVRPKKKRKRGQSGGSTDSCVSVEALDTDPKKKKTKKKLVNGGASASKISTTIESTIQSYEVVDNNASREDEDDEGDEVEDEEEFMTPGGSSAYSHYPSKTPISMDHVQKFKLGIIGVGAIGCGVAGNLLASGYEVFMWNRTASKMKMLQGRGAMACASPGDVVRSADITFVCLADDRAVRDVVHGKHGMKGSIDNSKSIVNLSTVDAETAITISRNVRDRGGRYLEAPVWGSKAAAEGGTLIVLSSGDKDLFNDVEPCFQMIGKSTQYLGDDIQRACKLKLILNMITGITMCGLSEGLSLAKKLDFDIRRVVNILDMGALGCPLVRTKGNAIAEESFPSSFPLRNQQKDLNLAINLSESVKGQAIFMSLANEMYKKAIRLGCGNEDMCAVYKAMT